MNATNTMLCWTPGTAVIALMPWPDPARWSKGYTYSDLACWDSIRERTRDQRRAYVLATAFRLIVRDECPAYAVDNALSNLEEYADSLTEDSRKPIPEGSASTNHGENQDLPTKLSARLSPALNGDQEPARRHSAFEDQ
jgi:hypothetical protein